MNAVPMYSLDIAMQKRAAVVNPRKPRFRSKGHLSFLKTGNILAISYPWAGGNFRNTVELIPVGVGRYAILSCGKWKATVASQHLLAALADYRRAAATALMDRMEAQS